MIELINKFFDFMPGYSGYVLIFVFIMSLAAFIAYGIDKRRAIKKKWRLSELFLLSLALFGGAFGAFLGMCVFRHKTKHWKFVITVPLLSVIYVIVIIKSMFI